MSMPKSSPLKRVKRLMRSHQLSVATTKCMQEAYISVTVTQGMKGMPLLSAYSNMNP